MHSRTWVYDVRLHTAGTNDERVFKKQNKERAVTASVTVFCSKKNEIW